MALTGYCSSREPVRGYDVVILNRYGLRATKCTPDFGLFRGGIGTFTADLTPIWPSEGLKHP